MKKSRLLIFLLSFVMLFSVGGCGKVPEIEQLLGQFTGSDAYTGESFDLDSIPAYNGQPYVVLNENVPAFTEEDFTEESFELYSPLDYLGRCGEVVANVGKDIMPVEERGSIGMVKPTGWHTIKYDVVKDKYLYNRCHLIGYQLTGENANERNLITGTRYLNTEGMLPFENRVAEYVNRSGNHVLYRVTPIFEGNNLLAKGVRMEAMSVEDKGEGIMFHIFCYNVQPGVEINYHDGSSRLAEKQNDISEGNAATYICNTNTMKFHIPSCSSATDMKEKNKKVYTGNRESLIAEGFAPCGNCKP